MITLRKCQKDALFGNEKYEGVFPMWERGKDNVLLQMATGLGKTIVMLAAMDEILRKNPSARIVLLVDQEKLAFQPIEKARKFYPHLAKVMGIVMDKYDDTAAQIVIASKHSLENLESGRIARILSWGQPDYVFIDECHHSAARSYRMVLAELGAYGGEHYWGDTEPAESDFIKYPQNAKLLGCTATPQRSDKIGLDIIFEGIAFKMDIEEAIELGYLVDYEIRGFIIDNTIKPEDYNTQEKAKSTVDDILAAQNAMKIVFDTFMKNAGDRGKTIVYCKSVIEAHAYAAYFTAEGVKSVAIDGKIKGDKRQAIYDEFERGDARCLMNVYIAVEGYDYPPADTILNLAPTKSPLITVQKLGRILRPAEGKTNALQLDFYPNADVDIYFGGGLDGKLPKNPWEVSTEPWLMECEECGFLFDDYDHDMTNCPSCESDCILRVKETETTFWKDGEIKQVVDPRAVKMIILRYKKKSSLPWFQNNGLSTAGIGKNLSLALLAPEPHRVEKARELQLNGNWDKDWQPLVEFLSSYRLYAVTNQRAYFITNLHDIKEIDKVALEYAKENGSDNLNNKKSKWRDEPISAKQLNALRRNGVKPNEMPAKRGKASQLLGWYITKRKVVALDTAIGMSILRGEDLKIT